MSDFRQYLRALAEAGQLVVVTEEVSPEFEVAAYVRRSSGRLSFLLTYLTLGRRPQLEGELGDPDVPRRGKSACGDPSALLPRLMEVARVGLLPARIESWSDVFDTWAGAIEHQVPEPL